MRLIALVGTAVALSSTAYAGTLSGKLELPPPPDRPAVVQKGFLDRVENPLTPVKPLNPATNMVVVLDSDAGPAAESTVQVSWEMAGESFTKPVIAVPVGAEILLKNTTKSTARLLVAAEDPHLIPGGPLNPGGPKSFRCKEAKTYTVGDADAPHLKGKIVVVTTPFVANVDENGKFEMPEVAAGTYKLRVYFFDPSLGKDGWIERTDDAVTITAKGKTDVTAKLPPGYPLKK